MEKILVTGATGFIGNYVIEQLIKRGCSVIATSTNVERARPLPWFGDVKYIPFDLGDFDPSTDYYRFFGEPEILIHLAWEGLPNYKSSIHLDTNYPRHVAFLENMARHGLKDITAIGTCFEYGMQEGN